jgi:hypothetical protein
MRSSSHNPEIVGLFSCNSQTAGSFYCNVGTRVSSSCEIEDNGTNLLCSGENKIILARSVDERIILL